ncbi:hypothetical protein [uncultured Thiohalocapsa sp.]|uniref:hypothetical protein n=1 Tax=uncultured Thiohalocapsa sp. TaxID=768990 RepID=UPI0025D12A0E|nr:hypothetical protein [uncultured Thiohalocapsa sp.]
MTDARLLRRHRAYFEGWAQAFGQHDLLRDPTQGLRWLLGDAQLGLMLDRSVRARLRGGSDDGLGGLLADAPGAPAAEPAGLWPPRRPVLTPALPALADVGTETLRLGRLTLRHCPARVVQTVRAMLAAQPELHLYETYHLRYPSGTRILTLSDRAPLRLIYRELSPALIRSAPQATPTAAPPRELACA